MLHPDIQIDADLEQTITDLLPVAAELREQSRTIIDLEPGRPGYLPTQAMITDLVQRIALRAERHDLTADALLVLLNMRLNEKARRGRGEPAGITARTLDDALTSAAVREERALLALSAAQIEMRAATAARIAAQQARAACRVGRPS
ncbi:hypothetical protein BH10PSE14_BH10PSE14_06360 [soil metagenome]